MDSSAPISALLVDIDILGFDLVDPLHEDVANVYGNAINIIYCLHRLYSHVSISYGGAADCEIL